jgi:hypothetical protein
LGVKYSWLAPKFRLYGLCTCKVRVGGFSGIAAGADSITDEIRIATTWVRAFPTGFKWVPHEIGRRIAEMEGQCRNRKVAIR